MRLPNLVLGESLLTDSSGNQTPFLVYGTAPETPSNDIVFNGRYGHNLSGDCHLRCTDISKLNVAARKFTLEYVGRPKNNSALWVSDNYPMADSLAVLIINRRIYVYSRWSVYNSTLASPIIPLELFEGSEDYHIGFVLDGTAGKLFIDYQLVAEFVVPAAVPLTFYALGYTDAINQRARMRYSGPLARVGFTGGFALPPSDFFLTKSPRNQSEAMSFISENGPLFKTTKTPLLISVAELDGQLVFKFNDGTTWLVARPVSMPPVAHVTGFSFSPVKELLVIDNTGTQHNVGLIPMEPGSQFEWPPGVGYLSSDTENPRYIPIEVGPGLLLADVAGKKIVAAAPTASSVLSFSSRVTLSRVFKLAESPFPSGAANTWVAYPFNKAVCDGISVNQLNAGSRFVLPSGKYVAVGNLALGGDIGSPSGAKARIVNVSTGEVFCETEIAALQGNPSPIAHIAFNDMFDVVVESECEIQFITRVPFSTNTLHSSNGIRYAETSKVQIFKA